MIYFVSKHGRTKQAIPVEPSDTVSVYHNADSLYIKIGGRIVSEYPLRSTITRAESVRKVVDAVFNAVLGAIQQSYKEDGVTVFDVDNIANGIINHIIKEG